MPPPTGKILVIRGGAIGDFILTLPVLSALRERFPDVHRELLGYPRVAQLALAAGLVDRVESIDARPMASFFARGGALPEHLAEYFAGFAWILSFLFDPDRIFQENVARCSKAQFVVGPYRPDEQGVHATDAFLAPLVRLAIFDADPTPKLTIPNPAAMGLAEPVAGPSAGSVRVREEPNWQSAGGPWLALHPGSGSETKNWPEERWSLLLRRLIKETSFRLLLIGGEAEGGRLDRLALSVPAERLQLARSLPLPELALRLRQCQGYVGHDSGISHMAAATGLPAVILWGHTRAEVWRPRGEGIRLITSEGGLAGLTVEDVFSAICAQFG